MTDKPTILSPARLGAIVSAYTGHVLGDIQPLLDYCTELLGKPVTMDQLHALHPKIKELALRDYHALGQWCREPPIADSELDAALALCQTVLADDLPPAPWRVEEEGGEATVYDSQNTTVAYTPRGYEFAPALMLATTARMVAAARLLLPSMAACLQELRVRLWLEQREHDREIAGERSNTDAAEMAARNASAVGEGPYCEHCGRGECN